jgi:L-rhamnose isomerase / sugar isomerase
MSKTKNFEMTASTIEDLNAPYAERVERSYKYLREKLAARGLNAQDIIAKVQKFSVAVPSWGTGTGGTRFGRFPGPGEPRNIFDKLEDAACIHRLTGATPTVALHIPWDKPEDPKELREHAAALGIGFDAMNSNTFQDQPDQKLSYKFGSLTHTDKAVRDQAVEHNIECIEIGKTLGSKAISVWIGDGGNYPGQVHFRKSMDRLFESYERIYAATPKEWRMFIEHKPYEPAFYSTVLQDWGTSYVLATKLGDRCSCLVDLGHHLPNTNIEQVVSRLIYTGKLGGFHFNDSKYGDDDLTTGSIKPYQLFLVFCELVDATNDPNVTDFNPAYMIDQSHNIKDPVEDLIQSVEELQKAYCRALLVNWTMLQEYQEANDVVMCERVLKCAFEEDVNTLVAMARLNGGAAIDPIKTFRASGYRRKKAEERPQVGPASAGIV